METLVDLLQTARTSFGSRIALSMRAGLREDTWSYEQLALAAQSVAHFLRTEFNLRPGDRLVIWAPNSPRLVASYFGAMLARIIVVPLDPASTPAFVSRVVEKARAAAIVTGFSTKELVNTRFISLDDLPFCSPGVPLSDAPQPDDVAEIVFTSGTTGAPKGVVLTHRNITASVESVRTLLPERPYRLLSFLPLSHMLEQTVGLYVPLLLGSTIYYPTSRGSSAVLKALKQHHITTLIVVPRVLELLLYSIERGVDRRHRRDQWDRAHRIAGHVPFRLRRLLFRSVHQALGGQLDFVISGGAPLDPSLAATWERMGVRAIQGYGATECAPIIATNSYWRRVPGSVGRPAPGVQLRLSSEGEILVRGVNITPGYWEDDAQTRDAFTDDNWYRTGDLGELDITGDLFLKGRLKDLIVLPSGLKVHPEDVEQELLTEADIQDCVVLGIPDETGTMAVHAVVIGETVETNAERRYQRIAQAVRHANARLALHQHITHFTIWEEGDFPRTNLLKVKRHEVLAALQGHARAIIPTTRFPSIAVDQHERLSHILSTVSDVSPESLVGETSLNLDLHLDSLARVELAILLEQEFGALLEDGDLAGIQTVDQLQGLLQKSETNVPTTVYASWPLSISIRIARDILQRLVIFPLHGFFCRPFTVEGRSHLDDIKPPILLIANHASHFDTPTILRALPTQLRRHVAVAAAADYFYHSRVVGFAVSLLLNTFPFSREGAVRSSLERCGELVDAGWSILIYPEGTRSSTGRLQPFRSGIGVLAAQLQVPVVPVVTRGTYMVLPKGRHWPSRVPVFVAFGAPIVFSPDADSASIAASLEESMTCLLSTVPRDSDRTETLASS